MVDGNIICSYALPGARTAAADLLRDRELEWCVPPLWRAEFRNVVVGQVRRGALDLAAAQELVALTEAMLRESGFAVDSSAVLARAAESGCTAHDCEYVVLAEELGEPRLRARNETPRNLAAPGRPHWRGVGDSNPWPPA